MNFLKKVKNKVDEYGVVLLIIMLSLLLISVPILIKMKEKKDNYLIVHDFNFSEISTDDKNNVFILVDYQHPVYFDNWYRHTLFKDNKKAP